MFIIYMPNAYTIERLFMFDTMRPLKLIDLSHPRFVTIKLIGEKQALMHGGVKHAPRDDTVYRLGGNPDEQTSRVE